VSSQVTDTCYLFDNTTPFVSGFVRDDNLKLDCFTTGSDVVNLGLNLPVWHYYSPFFKFRISPDIPNEIQQGMKIIN
jgi:hypothetical protein